MWQWFLDSIAYLTDVALGIAGLITFVGICYLTFKQKWNEIKPGDGSRFVFGVGAAALIVMFLHLNNKLTILDSHGDYLECRKCHKTIEEITCPNCGEKYSAMPVNDLPWEFAENSDRVPPAR